MKNHKLRLMLLQGTYAIARLEPEAEPPEWALADEFLSITKTQNELSIVCLAAFVPEGVRAERGFRCLQVVGPLEFTEVGVLEALARPLAVAGISIFAVSTYDTDFLLLPEHDLNLGLTALVDSGHIIQHPMANE